MDQSTKSFLLQYLGFTEGALPIRYLGLPLIAYRLSIRDSQPIIDRNKEKIDSWSSRFLTYAGRVLLVKSILFHYQVYWSNMFILPTKIIKTISSLCSQFIWQGKILRGIIPVAWGSACCPKEEGGLGLTQPKGWNSAACAKLLWRLVSNEDCL